MVRLLKLRKLVVPLQYTCTWHHGSTPLKIPHLLSFPQAQAHLSFLRLTSNWQLGSNPKAEETCPVLPIIYVQYAAPCCKLFRGDVQWPTSELEVKSGPPPFPLPKGVLDSPLKTTLFEL